MPIFSRKMDKEERKIYERKMCIAQEKPDEVFDLTNCGLVKVPERTYTLCRVLRKEILLLQHNRLKNLKDGGKIEDLAALKVIDVSYNEITALPKNIDALTNLQQLNLSFNKLKQLPDSIGCLKSLHILNLKGNNLKCLPSTIKYLQDLCRLDICSNEYLMQLPVNLCYLRNLEEFNYDRGRITYPPKEISMKGINEIRRWFMLVKGEEFAEEAEELRLKYAESTQENCYMPSSVDDGSAAIEDAISKREKEKELKRQQQLELEKKILDAQTENAILLSNAAKERQAALANVAFHEMRAQAEIHKAYEENEGNRTKLFQDLRKEEDSWNDTVSMVLQMAEKSRHTEELLEEIEADREKLEQLFKVTQEESENLRKQEIIRSMTMVMEELEKQQQMYEKYEKSRDAVSDSALRRFAESNCDVETLLVERDAERADLLQKVANEEAAQKEVFRVLQYQKDAKLVRIRKQIDMIQNELMKISIMEMERRQAREEEEMNRLADMRINTALLLSNLIDEQEKRERELVKRLEEMENYKKDEAMDYWLIQFQRLLDSKPQVLIDEENQLDVYVADILVGCDAKQYLPMFARRKITREQLKEITDNELKDIGVRDEKARAGILSAVENQISLDARRIEKSFSKSKSVDDASEAASAPSISGLVARSEAECVVCLDQAPDMIFLNCGHVCTCSICSLPLNQCPLCRQEIVQKCRLYGT